MTQPPGPWRPAGPLPPPHARPLPPRPAPPPPGYRTPLPGQHAWGQPGPQPPAGPYQPPQQAGQPPPGQHAWGQPGQQPPAGPDQPPQQAGPSPTAQFPQVQPPHPVPRYYQPGYSNYPSPGMPASATTPPWLNYPGHPGMLAPRRKSNTGAIVATVLVSVLVVAVGLVGLLALNDKDDHVADTGYDSSTSSTTETTTDETTTTTTTETETTEETTDDTPTETTPEGPQPVYELGENPLFAGDVGLPAVTCQLTRWDTSPQGAAAFFNSALPCLDAAWQPVMEQAGLPFFTPGIQFPEGTDWSSPCGEVAGSSGAVAAFYCGRDNTLYMPFAGLQTEMYGAHPGVYLAVLSHEYGHHVQAMSGVLDTYAQARYDSGVDSEAGLELSRRLELQAQCLSGMFFASTYSRGSVDDNILTEARTSQERGDHHPDLPRDHGTDENSVGWWEQGAQQNRTWQCNTWLSPPEDVA